MKLVFRAYEKCFHLVRKNLGLVVDAHHMGFPVKDQHRKGEKFENIIGQFGIDRITVGEAHNFCGMHQMRAQLLEQGRRVTPHFDGL